MKDYYRFDLTYDDTLKMINSIFNDFTINKKTNVLQFKIENRIFKYFIYNLDFFTTCLKRIYS